MSTGADMMLSTERESSAFDSAPDYPGLASPTYDQVYIVATTSHDAAHHLFYFLAHTLRLALHNTHTDSRTGEWRNKPKEGIIGAQISDSFFLNTISGRG